MYQVQQSSKYEEVCKHTVNRVAVHPTRAHAKATCHLISMCTCVKKHNHM